jgi:hypothetical protein
VAIVHFPDGTCVRASSISDRRVDDPERAYGLYLDPRWEPSWPATLVDWKDFGLPENPELAGSRSPTPLAERNWAGSSRLAAWAAAVEPAP